MLRQTLLLRVLLVVLLLGALGAYGLLYLVSLDLAQTYPEYAHLRLPLFGAAVLVLLPVLVAVRVVFEVLGLIDRAEAFSAATVELLGRLALLLGGTAAYLALGFGWAWWGLGLVKAHLLLGWLGAEAVVLFLFVVASLLQRLFAAGVVLRQDSELTV